MTGLRKMTSDPEYESLKTRRILPVLNDGVTETDAFVLEADSAEPPALPIDVDETRARVLAALQSVHDPEIPLNIYDLGLIYAFDVSEDGNVHVQMTLTAPGCPVAGSLVKEVHDKVLGVSGVRHAKTELVWEPAWSKDRMSDAAKLELGLY